MSSHIFTNYIPTGPYDHFGVGPVNWSFISRIEKYDVSYAGSESMDHRDQCGIKVFYNDRILPDVWWFEFDREMRDAIFDAMIAAERKQISY